MNTTIWVVIIAVIILGAWYVYSRYSASTNSTFKESSPAVLEASISIENFSFNPAEVHLKAGGQAIWLNNDSVTHTVDSDSGLFSSQPLAKGDRYAFVFKDSGSFPYHCALHPSMKGIIVVE